MRASTIALILIGRPPEEMPRAAAVFRVSFLNVSAQYHYSGVPETHFSGHIASLGPFPANATSVSVTLVALCNSITPV
jgi:hypothetical protein